MTFSRGSEWRRWDLHVHTPETALNDQFGTWDEYLYAVEGQEAVKVIGATDYLSIQNYSRLAQERRNGRLVNIELLIPNIEFRIAPPTDRATAVNIHLLVDPTDPKHEEEIVRSLSRLTWTYNGRKYSCLPDQLMALGRAFDSKAAVSDRQALQIGVTQFKVDFTTFQTWHNSEPWLMKNSIVAVAAGMDGLSGFQRDGAWAGYREEITRFCRIVFSGRPGEREFWLGQNPQHAETVKKLGGPKPCIHGSDAHAMEKLFNPDQARYCWIKADPTFEGFKQTLYEPEDRVHIGPTPPDYHDRARVIERITLSRSNGWFDDAEIPLNSGLVSIIGQKGSGKSALAEVIAFSAGSWISNEQGSFLKRAGKHMHDVVVELLWGDGERSSIRLGDDQSNDHSVRYLSQKFVERLCAEDRIGAELVREIEAVVFSYLDPTDTLNASTFEELRALRTKGIREESDRLREDVRRVIREECALRDNAAKVTEKKARIKSLREEKEGLEKQLPKPTTAAEAELHKLLQAKRQALAAIQQVIGTEKQKGQRIRDIRTRVNSLKAQLARFSSDIDATLQEAGIAPSDWALFHPQFPGDTEAPLVRQEALLNASLEEKMGRVDSPAEGTVRKLQKEIEALEKQESLDKTLQEKTKLIQVRLSAIDTEVERITKEITQVEGPEAERIKTARTERSRSYVSYFENLRHEQDTLRELYEPVSARLTEDRASKQERALEFSIQWHADLANWLERGSALFDQRKTIPYGTMQALSDAAKRILVPAWTSGEPAQIESALDQFLIEFRKPDLPWARYARAGVTVQDIFEWLYEVDHVRLSYGLKYNGVELEKLSPGTKGIVLLILYLGMDVADSRPLIVDQPDENLDNESIYDLLTAYFRTSKKRRQIILITHNPNLVVNADSEQVIVATAVRRDSGLPAISYCSGSLESDGPFPKGIRSQVCRILEGGSDAFLRRELRYSLGNNQTEAHLGLGAA